MNSLDEYWTEYNTTYPTTDNCYIEPYYQTYPYTISYYTKERNKTEEAFNILKIMVAEKLVKEPTTFKKFCELVEKIAKVI